MYKNLFFGRKYQEYKIGQITYLAKDNPLTLHNGVNISNFPIAYQTYGTLNEKKDNAILICHALTGDQYVASTNPITKKPGWWNHIIGEHKAIDTKKYFIICSNILGGCMGSLSPKENNPKTNQPYNLDFPVFTIDDIVKVQKLLITEHFKINKLYAVIGGSMGGMQVLQWASQYPEYIKCAISIASSARHTAQNIAFHEIARQAIMSDKNWYNGNYIAKKLIPEKGLSVARMIAHVTYLSEYALAEKFGRNLQDKDKLSFGFNIDFQVESYLRHQGVNFVDRFDANCYLYVTRAMDYFDLEEKFNGKLYQAFANSQNVKFCLISFSDDWLFPTSESKLILKALNQLSMQVSFIDIKSNRGHDSFLIENHDLYEILQGFLTGNLNNT
jgi:homoserine O-acetyltransferase